jgi:uridine phosphorylase
MGIPNVPDKLAFRAVIDPKRVVHDLKAQGRYPSCAIPSGAIVYYDSLLWQRVCALPQRVECDGALTGAFLLPHGDAWILAIKAAGFGAPTAVMTLEELIALGVSRFVNLGTAGGLQETMQVGDIVVCDRAIRDEGTSYHYLPDAKYACASPALTQALCAAIAARGLPVRIGTSWTTDAPYRETTEEIRRYRAEGVATVEMEASALFAVGEYRGVSVAAIFAVSDILSENGWASAYRTPEVTDHLLQIGAIALHTLSTYDAPGTATSPCCEAGGDNRPTTLAAPATVAIASPPEEADHETAVQTAVKDTGDE